MTDRRDSALRSWFLGPRAENAALLEGLVVEALRDHVFWRRNFHPEDGFAIRELDKRSEGYEDAVATLTQELLGLLAELKRDVPFFSGRYKGHMLFEQTIAAQIGYFAAMLYNPNNISAEAAPVTTRLELDVAAQLARMIGYDPGTAWGHLTSGGTVANFEALWIARNVHYLAVAAAGAAESLGLSLELAMPGGGRTPAAKLPLWELLNVDNAAALDLWHALWQSAPEADVSRALARHTLSDVGYQDYSLTLEKRFGDALPAAVVLVASTAHYSWKKIARALGIGANQVMHIPVDPHFRLDPDALWDQLRDCAERRIPVLACVSVCGTTEESAVDRLERVLDVRERARRELGIAFHLHSDAAYGGYAAAVTWREDGIRRSGREIRRSTGTAWPDDAWVDAMVALGETDSISLDPHKLGYVPYPAGAFLLRDRRARDLVAVNPPYLTPATASRADDELFLGRYIFEGSKPGAAAAAVWLSHKVLPLDERGYGYLVERTAVGALRLRDALSQAGPGEFSVLVLPEPDINIVCFVVRPRAGASLAELNALNEGIYRRMSLNSATPSPEYIITRTRFQTPTYDGAVGPILAQLSVGEDEWKAAGGEGLVVLRSTVMDPFLAAAGPGTDHVAGFIEALGRAAREASRGGG